MRRVGRCIVEAVECFTTRWHKDEAESSWLRHAKEDAKSDDKGRGAGIGEAAVLILLSTNAENEIIDRVARYRFD